ncbi:hypothetical protein DPMN_045482 [Dreissena polymorpha]|uniref:BHLH domain-containing protein n=1 Tax=Dreissena polymorpha TaxID=45954 RepID=A0A9D4D627_DREPO|nr:hypothetical protein DPMN_045482 [Dreissena polymorpha]
MSNARTVQKTTGKEVHVDERPISATEDVSDNDVSDITLRPSESIESAFSKTNNITRAKINMRERRRMRDLNVAMDALREVIPFSNGPTVRKLSKISTLSLARNYIITLTKSVEDLRRMFRDLHSVAPNSELRHYRTSGSELERDMYHNYCKHLWNGIGITHTIGPVCFNSHFDNQNALMREFYSCSRRYDAKTDMTSNNQSTFTLCMEHKCCSVRNMHSCK